MLHGDSSDVRVRMQLLITHGDSPQEGNHILNCVQQGRPKVIFSMAAACAWTASGLLYYDGMPKACKMIRKEKNDKVKTIIANLYVYFYHLK